jgi:5-oxoprolinase (ATP-hydrolysing) subunit A
MKMKYRVDLNCDMGESFGSYKMGNDEEILDFVTSANIACGFHAGDPSTMRKTVRLALERGVGIGAHPGFQDMAGFGRRNIVLSSQEAFDIVIYQIGALFGFVKAEGGVMQHVKPHGALYNMAAADVVLAEAIAEAVYAVDPELILFGLSGSEIVKAGNRIGLRVANEVFSDRTYQDNGMLTDRKEAAALITHPDKAVQQVVRMIKTRNVQSADGKTVPILADTVCVHGDGRHALEFARLISGTLKSSEIDVVNFHHSW